MPLFLHHHIASCHESPLDLARRTAPNRRAGDGVAGQLLVDADEDTWIGGLVESGRGLTTRLGASGSCDLQVDALWVVLGSVLVAGGVQADDLVAEDVIAAGQAAWDGGSPRDVVCWQRLSGSEYEHCVGQTYPIAGQMPTCLEGLSHR